MLSGECHLDWPISRMGLLHVLARSTLRGAQRLVPHLAAEPRLTVLTYHLTGAGTDSPVDVPLEVFEQQLAIIKEVADPVSLEDGIERLQQETVGRPMVAVTFDDAFENFYITAWPRLRSAAIPVTLFVPVGFVEGDCPSPLRGAEELPAASWRQLREMAREGLTVGSHSWSHCDLRRVANDPARVERELRDSRNRIEDEVGSSARTFCYPRGLWSRAAERQVATAYDGAVVAGGRRISRSNLRPLRIWRLPVRRDGQGRFSEALEAPLVLEEWLADKIRRLAW